MMSWRRNAEARPSHAQQSQSPDECAGGRWTSTLTGVRARRRAPPDWATACRLATACGFSRTLTPSDFAASADSEAAGSGSVRPQPPRAGLDELLHGRRADGLRLVSGVLFGLFGLV